MRSVRKGASVLSCPGERVANPVDGCRVGAEDRLEEGGRVRVAEVLERELLLDGDERRGIAVEVEAVRVGRALDLPREDVPWDVEEEGDERDRERDGRDDDRAGLVARGAPAAAACTHERPPKRRRTRPAAARPKTRPAAARVRL